MNSVVLRTVLALLLSLGASVLACSDPGTTPDVGANVGETDTGDVGVNVGETDTGDAGVDVGEMDTEDVGADVGEADTEDVGVDVGEADTGDVGVDTQDTADVQDASDVGDASDTTEDPPPGPCDGEDLTQFGASGEPLDGQLVVTVCETVGEPLADAFVMAVDSSGESIHALTDDDGTVVLEEDNLEGPHTVVATAPEYSTTSFHGIDADEIRLFVSPLEMSGTPPEVETATFSGELTGIDDIPLGDDPDEIRFGWVTTTAEFLSQQLPDAGDDDSRQDDGEYEMTTRTGPLALVALGLVYNTETEEISVERIGIQRDLEAEPGGEYEVDLALDIPVDDTLDVQMGDPPPIGDAEEDRTYEGTLFVDMQDDGYLRLDPVEVDGASMTFPRLPEEAQAVLDDVTFAADLFVEVPGDDANPFGAYSRASVDNIDVFGDDENLSVTTPPAVGMPDFIAPDIQDYTTEDRRVHWDLIGEHEPDIYWFQVFSLNGPTHWHIFVSGDTDEFRFPEFPDFQQEYDFGDDSDGDPLVPQPYPEGLWWMGVNGVGNFGSGSLDAFQYGLVMRHYSRTFRRLSFPPQ